MPNSPNSLLSFSGHSLHQSVVRWSLLFLCMLLLVQVSLVLAPTDARDVLIWLPNGLVFVLLLRVPARHWPGLLLVTLLAGLCGRLLMAGVGPRLLLSLTDLLEVVLGAALVNHWCWRNGQPLTIRVLLPILLIYPVLAVSPTALLAAEIFHHGLQVPHLTAMINHWLGHTFGFILLAVPALLWNRVDLQPLRSWPQLLQGLILGLLTAVSYGLLRHVPVPFIYMCALFSVIAYRYGALRTMTHAILVLVILGCLWWLRLISLDNVVTLLGPRGIWLATAITYLFPALLGVAVEDLRREQQAVSELTRRLKLATGALHLGAWDWNMGKQELVWDARMFELYDLPPDSAPLEMASWLRRLHPRDRRRVQEDLEGALQHGGEFHTEYRLQRPDGGYRHIRAAGNMLLEDSQRRLVGVNWDVTAEREALQATRDARMRLNAVINSASEFSIVSTTPEGVIDLFSQGAERMLGYSAAEMLGFATPLQFHLADEIHQRSRELCAELGRPVDGFEVFVEAARRGQAEAREWTYVRKDGSRLTVKLVVTAIRDDQQQITGFLGVAQDISEQKKAQQALARAKEGAEAASRAKSEFLANMSHEIRTPLNAILGATDLLKNLPLADDVRHYIRMIRTSGTSLLGVINDVLDFSKIEAGRMELAHEPFDLDEVLESIANLMAINVGSKGIELAIGLAPDVPRCWLGDALRLTQVLMNLVGNAIKFTEQGEVVVQVALGEQAAGRGRLRVQVRDTGIGMNDEQQQRLFQAFSQADSSMSRRFGGSGLGLVICQRLVHLMGGDIRVQSRPGAGSEFSFEVVLEMATAQPLPRLPLGAGQRLVLVGRPDVGREILLRQLQQWGWQVETAAFGDAVPLAPADLLLVNAQGSEAALPALATLPARRRLLLLGAHARQQGGDWQGWDKLLIKPVTPAALYDAVRQHHPRQPQAKATGDMPQPLAGVRILLVEDNALNQIVACGLLEQAGARVDVVGDGRQAVDWLRQRAADYQLVLMDVQMPVLDGFSATRLLRDELGLTLPIIAMSAGVMLEEQQQCLASGMDGFISKPIDFDRMINSLLFHLQRPALKQPPGDVVAPATPALFDPDNLLRMTRGKPERLRDVGAMIGRLVAEGTGPVSQGRALLQQGDRDAAIRHFHALKGALGNLGARRAWAQVQALETALRDAAGPDPEPLLQQAAQTLADTCAAAADWLARHPELAASGTPSN